MVGVSHASMTTYALSITEKTQCSRQRATDFCQLPECCRPEFFLCAFNVWTSALDPKKHLKNGGRRSCVVRSPACVRLQPYKHHECVTTEFQPELEFIWCLAGKTCLFTCLCRNSELLPGAHGRHPVSDRQPAPQIQKHHRHRADRYASVFVCVACRCRCMAMCSSTNCTKEKSRFLSLLPV